jgi:hypothetical protein
MASSVFVGQKSQAAREPTRKFLWPRNDCWPYRPSDAGAMSPAGARQACATCARSQCLPPALSGRCVHPRVPFVRTKSVLATRAIRPWRGCSKSVLAIGANGSLAIGANGSLGRLRLSTATPSGPAPSTGPAPSPGPLPAPPPHAGSAPALRSPPGRPAHHGLARGLQGSLSRRSRPRPAGHQLGRALSGRDVVCPRNFANGWPFFAARAFGAPSEASCRLETACSGADTDPSDRPDHGRPQASLEAGARAVLEVGRAGGEGAPPDDRYAGRRCITVIEGKPVFQPYSSLIPALFQPGPAGAAADPIAVMARPKQQTNCRYASPAGAIPAF